MGKDLYEQFATARDLYDLADETLGFGLSRLCFEGPEQELLQTRNSQPAIAVTSLALLKVATEIAPEILERPAYMAGHSLGEYSALVAAGALSFVDGLRLLRLRGDLMQRAADQTSGTMAAIIGLDATKCDEACRVAGAEISADNAVGQIVIGGPLGAVARALEEAKGRGATGALPLNVSGAFHTSLMQSAATALTQPIAEADLADAAVPVVANCTVEALTAPASIRVELVDQICHTVRWRRTVEFLAGSGVQTYFEFGPGRVLTSIIRRSQPAAARINVNDAASALAQRTAG